VHLDYAGSFPATRGLRGMLDCGGISGQHEGPDALEIRAQSEADGGGDQMPARQRMQGRVYGRVLLCDAWSGRGTRAAALFGDG
jgi:hypothetical protein